MQVDSILYRWVRMFIGYHMNRLPKHYVLAKVIAAVIAVLIKSHALRFIASPAKVFENKLNKEFLRDLRIFLQIVRTGCVLGEVKRVISLRNERSIKCYSADLVVIDHASVLECKMYISIENWFLSFFKLEFHNLLI